MARGWQGDGKRMARGWQEDGKGMARRWRDDGKGMARGWQDDGKGMARRWQGDGKSWHAEPARKRSALSWHAASPAARQRSEPRVLWQGVRCVSTVRCAPSGAARGRSNAGQHAWINALQRPEPRVAARARQCKTIQRDFADPQLAGWLASACSTKIVRRGDGALCPFRQGKGHRNAGQRAWINALQ